MRKYLLAVLTCFAFCTAATAQQIQITGHITASGYAPEEPETAATFTVGEQYVMTYQWVGPGAPRPAPVGSPNTGYPDAAISMLVSTDDYWVSAGPVEYILGGQAGLYSRVNVFSSGFRSPLAFPGLLDGRFPMYVIVQLDDPTGTSLTSLDLLGPTFDLSKFPAREMEITFARSINSFSAEGVLRVKGTVDTMIIMSAVPEPSTPAFALLGLAFIAATARCRSRLVA